MPSDLDGNRFRYFHERVALEARQGNPLRRDVSGAARDRLMREVEQRLRSEGLSNILKLSAESERVLGIKVSDFVLQTQHLAVGEFLSFLEMAVQALRVARGDDQDLPLIQSILADDFSSYRLVEVRGDRYQVQLIDNEHLHREIVDRTFELTRNAAFQSAQSSYAEAWKHYSKGDFDDALVNAHKAFESACKIIIKRVDPTSAPEQLQTNQLLPLLVSLDIIPQRLQHTATQLYSLFMNAGTLRNSAGAGHGSLDLTTPEAEVALLGLRLSGTYVAYLAGRWEQMKPKT